MTIRFLSVCSGLEGASLAFESLGWTAVGFSEIEAFPSAIIAHHYGSNMPGDPLSTNAPPNFGDFTAIQADDVGPIDVLIGGSPCQDFSIAGLRAGIAGARGNLTVELLKLLDRIKPEWFVFENVPGLLSIDSGKTFEELLCAINELGYGIDCDILDAQHFGVPQRRRRVFLVCHNVEIGRKKRTPYFAMSFGAFLTDCLVSVLAAQVAPSSAGLKLSDWPSRFAADGLRLRMKLFGLWSDKPGGYTITMTPYFLNLLVDWTETCPKYRREQNASDFRSENESHLDVILAERLPIGSVATAVVPPSMSTSLSWSAIWDALQETANVSTTLTVTKKTTNSTIYICAEAALSIVEFTINSMISHPICFDEDSSGLTALRAFTNYARQTNSDLFGRLESVCDWGDFIRRAERAISEAERHFGDRAYSGALFPIPQGLQGNPTPRRETRERVAGTLNARTQGGGGLGTDFELSGGLVEAPALARCVATREGSSQDYETTTMIACERADSLTVGANQTIGFVGDIVAHSLCGEGFDASEDGTGRGTPIVPVYAIQERAVSENPNAGPQGADVQRDIGYTLEARHHVQSVAYRTSGNCGAWETGDKTDALTTGTDPNSHIVAFTSKDYGGDAQCDVAPTLRSMGHDASHANGGGQLAVAFDMRGREGGAQFEGPHDTANIRAASGGSSCSYVAVDVVNGNSTPETMRDCAFPLRADDGSGNRQAIAQNWAVRRLTPTECEKLQGVPVGYTKIPWRGKPSEECPDGPRYRVLGNSWAIPVVSWLGRRINACLTKQG